MKLKQCLLLKILLLNKRKLRLQHIHAKKKTYLLHDKLPDNVEIEVIEHKLNEAERNCPECGAVMQEIGQDVRRKLVIIPAKVKVLEHHIYSYACQACKQNNIETPVTKAKKETALIPGGFATPEAVADIITQKIYNGISIISAGARMEKPGY